LNPDREQSPDFPSLENEEISRGVHATKKRSVHEEGKNVMNDSFGEG